MPSKMSLFNKELILQIGRSTGWISIVYFLSLLFILPIRLLMMLSDQNMGAELHFTNLFKYNTPLQIGVMVIVPILLGVFLFRFLQVKQTSDLMHSLPIRRERIFHHYTITGIVFLVWPVIVITFIILSMHSTLEINSWFSVKDILYWAGATIVITLLLFIAGVFMAMMTGISAVQAVLSYIFLFFPMGIMLLLYLNLKILLYGFPSDYYLNQRLEKMSPITYAAVLDTRILHWGYAILYLVFSIILYGLAFFFYKKRRLEAAAEAIAFPRLRVIFKYGTASCTMLLGGSYFNEASFKSLSWTLFGYAAGAILGYIVAEMVLQKTWRVYSNFKGLLVYGALIALLVIGVQTFGIYVNRIPDEKEIKNVLLTENININDSDMYNKMFTPKPLTSRANIEEVRKLHKQILSDRDINYGKNNFQTRTLYFVYELKNGNHVIREYAVNELLYTDFLKPIYESKEYKKATYEIFHLNDNSVKNITIRPNGPDNKMVNLLDSKDLHEVITALREDILTEKYEDSLYYQNTGPMIEINLGHDKLINLEFKLNYQHLAEWLKNKNLLDQAKVTADEISHILIAKVDSPKMYDSAKLKMDVEKSSESLNVTDESQIEELLTKSSSIPSLEYKAVFYYKNGQFSDVLFFDGDHIPDFVRSGIK
jgi:ABC-2 type transport system permease protein